MHSGNVFRPDLDSEKALVRAASKAALFAPKTNQCNVGSALRIVSGTRKLHLNWILPRSVFTRNENFGSGNRSCMKAPTFRPLRMILLKRLISSFSSRALLSSSKQPTTATS